MVNTAMPDEKTVMTYVSSYYHTFSGAQKAETAANRICKVLKVNQDNEHLMEDYERLASDLLEWIKRWIPWLENRPGNSTLAAIQQRLEDFRQYRRREKPPRIEQKGRLETSFNTLQTKLRLSNRPAYLPTEGKTVQDIHRAWKSLEHGEKGFEDWLLSEMMRLERLEHLAEKFRRKCRIYEEWSSGKEEMLSSSDYKGCQLYEVKALRKRHEAFESDLTAHQDRVEQIAAIAQELNTLRYPDIASINQKCQQICEQWDRLGTLTQKRRQNLEECERLMEKIDQLYLDFAKRAAPFSNWLDSIREDLQDMFIVHTSQEIKSLVQAHEQFKATLGEADTEFRSVVGIDQEIVRIVESHSLHQQLLHNPYTTVSVQDVQRKWNEVQHLVPKRDAQLQQEMTKQESNDHIRQQFAQKANEVGPWLEKQLETVASIGHGGRGSLEQAIQHLHELYTTVQNYKRNMDELEKYNQNLQENYIFENPFTRYTMESLRVGWEQLITSINRTINEIENQILTRDSKGIKEQELNELKASFSHFNKTRQGLDPDELKSCLISVGYNIKPGKEGDIEFQRVMNILDPNRTGRVSFDAFLDFMTKETADMDSAEQIIESFRVLAAGKPFITADELHRELPPDQAEYCLQRMPLFRGQGAIQGSYDYVLFSHTLYGESDL